MKKWRLRISKNKRQEKEEKDYKRCQEFNQKQP